MRKNGQRRTVAALPKETSRNVMGLEVGLGHRGEISTMHAQKSWTGCPAGYTRLAKAEAFAASKGFSETVCAKGECPLLPNGNLHMSDVLSLTVTVGDKTFNDDDPALAYSKATGQTAHFLILCKSHVPAIYPSCMPTTVSARSQTTVHVLVHKGAAPSPDVTYAPGAFLPHHAWQAKLVDLGGGVKGWAAVVAAGHTVHVFSASLGSLYIQPGGHLNPYVSLLCGYSLPGGGGSGVYGTPGVGCPSDAQVQGSCPDGFYMCSHDKVCKRTTSSEAFG